MVPVIRFFALSALSLLAMGLAVFVCLQANPDAIAGRVLGPYVSAEQKALWLQSRGLAEPFWERFIAWLTALLQGDLGWSYTFDRPVIQVLAPRIGVSAVLGFWTLVIALPLGLLLALPAALREGGAYDRIAGFGAIAATSVPEFAWAMLATVVFVFQLGWPGTTLPGAAVTADAQFLPALVLPVLVLVAFDVGYVQRLARTALVDVMGRPFMATAQMKGLGQGRILFVHGLPHLVPLLLSILALQINWVMSGVIVAEVAFAQDGLGRLIWDAALAGDTSLLQACAMLAAGIAILSRALADALLAATWRRGPARW